MMKRYKLGLAVAVTAMVIGGLSFAATQTEWLKGALLAPTGLQVIGTGTQEIDLNWDDGRTLVELGRWKTITPNQMTAENVIFTAGTENLNAANLVDNYFQNLEVRVLSMEGPAVLRYPVSIDVGFNPEFDTIWSLWGSPIPTQEDEYEAAGLVGSEIYAFFSGPVSMVTKTDPIIYQDGDFGGNILGLEAAPIYCGSFEITSPTEGETEEGDTFETTVTINAKNEDSSPYTGGIFYTSTDPAATFNGQTTPVTIADTSVEYVGSESSTIEVSAPGDTDPDQNCLEHVNIVLEPTPVVVDEEPTATDYLTVSEVRSNPVEIEWDSGNTYILGKWTVQSSIDAEVEAVALNVGTLRDSITNNGGGRPELYFTDLEFTVTTMGQSNKVYEYPYGYDHALTPKAASQWTLRGTPIADKEDEFLAAGLNGKKVYGYYVAVSPDGEVDQDEDGSWGGVALNTTDEEIPVEEEPAPEEVPAEEVPVEEDDEDTIIYNTYYYDEETDEDEGLDEDTVEILTSDDYVCGDPFTDTNSLEETLEDLICRNYEANIVDGRDPDHYKPFEYITRAEFLKITLRSAGYLTSDADGLSESFADVDGDDWFLPYVVIGYSEGYIVGDGENFRPNDPITRADAVVIGMRVSGEALNDDDNPFGDIDGDEYYADAVITAGNTTVDVPDEGEQTVVGGFDDGDFHPMDFISRGDAAALVNRMAIAFFLEEIAESLE